MLETLVIRVDPQSFAPSALDPAVDALRRGGLVGLSTEAVYEVAADASRPEAVARLAEFGAAARLLADRDELRSVMPGTLPAAAQRLIQRFWPGPLTLQFPDVTLRYPNHPIALAFLKRAAAPVLAAPAGEPAALSGEEALERLKGKVEVLLDAGPSKHHAPPTVLRIRDGRAELVREGAIPKSVIDEVNVTTLLFVCTGNTCRSPMAEALARKLLAERLKVPESEIGEHGWRVVSAGTQAGLGGAAAEEAEQAVKLYGADLTNHESRPVTLSLVEEADRVYVMTGRHRKQLLDWMPEHAAKIQLLDPSGREIDDPIGGTAEMYRTTAKQIQEILVQRLKELP